MNSVTLGTIVLCLIGTLADSPWHNPNCEGNRRIIVQLFEWKWTDVALECERFLGPRGYCGVQVSPVNEHAVIGVNESGVPDDSDYPRPWWERYQPVSYKMTSRSGTEQQFVDMVQRCNNVGVRIYVDAVINHMTLVGGSGKGSAGSEFDAHRGYYPGVPYEMDNFNNCSTCPQCCCVNNWTDIISVRNCRWRDLMDLNQKVDDTKVKITSFLNSLIGIGVAGFRLAASKHMWPDDIKQILTGLDDLDTRWFGARSKPFIYLEVTNRNNTDEIRPQEYVHLGRVTEFRFCERIARALEFMSILDIYAARLDMVNPNDAFVFVDNHDIQRGIEGDGNVVTFKNPERYKTAQAISLGWQYGYQRVMSSYDYGDDIDIGPPSDENFVTKDVIINDDGSCGNGWICEHRWPVIAGMAGWAKATNGIQYATYFSSQGNRAAYWNKQDKGFVLVTVNGNFSGAVYTGLPAGSYCNVMQGCATESGCEGDIIDVDLRRTTSISITDPKSPVVAIHVECKAGSNQCVDSTTPTPVPQVPTDPTTQPGKDDILRGGITEREEKDILTTTATTQPPIETTTESTSTAGTTTESTSTLDAKAIEEMDAFTTTAQPPTDTTTESTSTLGTTTESTSTLDATSTEGTSTTTKPGEDWKVTTVYMKIDTQPGQDAFLRGGVTEQDCTDEVVTDPCAIPIKTIILGSDPHFEKYESWRVGDTHLDWFGAEPLQGNHDGVPSEGTPMAWTTDDNSHPGFQPDNDFGPNWWKVEMVMDCSKAFESEGWFEFRSFVSNRGWENDIIQDTTCTGTAGGSSPYDSQNHMGRCGYFNVFEFNSGSCIIDEHDQ